MIIIIIIIIIMMIIIIENFYTALFSDLHKLTALYKKCSLILKKSTLRIM